ncbi:DUF4870 domain-containing protein [Mesobacillus zeae]|uniref:DUF4870 domain-containing protein n=1 Tax=Mesobacillus zeae TaxID=1917180 RepID=A0A398BCJ0_9BACI|nr:DUF4870 domain-containing protein [Mesobacillus zeae]RID85530.1 DUF4870 domain-containing protein [Mesobacillus zeae]
MPSNEERMLATGIYIISFFTAFIGPLIIWLMKKDESSFIDYHGREYFNFFISYSVYALISFILMIVLVGFVLFWILGIAALIFTVIGAVKAFSGEQYRIPFIFRLL